MGYPGDLQGSSNTIRMEKCLYYGLSEVWKLDDVFLHVNIGLHLCSSFTINQKVCAICFGQGLCCDESCPVYSEKIWKNNDMTIC